jgi:hypothetical protein
MEEVRKWYLEGCSWDSGWGVGASSATISYLLFGVPGPEDPYFGWSISGDKCKDIPDLFEHLLSEKAHPHDADDLSRCVRLIRLVPSMVQDHRLANLSPIWKKIVENWEYLDSLFDANCKYDCKATEKYRQKVGIEW